ncbi:MAG: hypothetical protein KDB23_22045 [Planctomycetales bacterium]|nr:hypothetical protein [Planctomycetales bacterium]
MPPPSVASREVDAIDGRGDNRIEQAANRSDRVAAKLRNAADYLRVAANLQSAVTRQAIFTRRGCAAEVMD